MRLLQTLLETNDKQRLLEMQQRLIDALDEQWNVAVSVQAGQPACIATRSGKIIGYVGKPTVAYHMHSKEVQCTIKTDENFTGVPRKFRADNMHDAVRLIEMLCKACDLGVEVSKTKKTASVMFGDIKEDLFMVIVGTTTIAGDIGVRLSDSLKWTVVVKGYKTDIFAVDEGDEQEVLDLIKAFSLKWMRDNDPDGERW